MLDRRRDRNDVFALTDGRIWNCTKGQTNMQLPILRFDPILKTAVWGGDKLSTVLGKEPLEGAALAESWELVDLPAAQSIVQVGSLMGKSLGDLIAERKEALIAETSLMDGRFPLLFKFIDAKHTLSVQVHPEKAAALRLGGGARPKNEAWYIVDCEPGACIYAGLKSGVTAEVFMAAILNDTAGDCLCRIPVAPGEFYNIPAGTVHAIGAGVLLAEVQQASDTTYRLYDWGRVDTDGKPRALHVEQALASIDFEKNTAGDALASAESRGVETPYFHLYCLELNPGEPRHIAAEKPVALMGVGGDGVATVRAGESIEYLRLGRTLLVPACISESLTISASEYLRVLVVEIP